MDEPRGSPAEDPNAHRAGGEWSAAAKFPVSKYMDAARHPAMYEQVHLTRNSLNSLLLRNLVKTFFAKSMVDRNVEFEMVKSKG